MRAINFHDSYLVVELTNRCPFSCSHCIQGTAADQQHFAQLGEFDPRMLAALLDDLAQSGIRFQNLIAFWLGEPLMHSKFADIYGTILEHNARHRTFDQIEVHTNALLLNEKIARMVVQGPEIKQKWHFTLDAASPETFGLVKGNENFERVIENVERMVRLRREYNAMFPAFVYQFIVRRENQHEANDFVARWRGFMDELDYPVETAGGGVPNDGRDYIFFRLYDALDFSEQPAANYLYSETLKRVGAVGRRLSPWDEVRARWRQVMARARPKICSGMWKSPVINFDGRVTVCTRDTGLGLQVGDLRERPFSEIWWNNPRLDEMRRMQMVRDFGEIDFCDGCIIPQSANYTGITQAELARWGSRFK